MPLTSNLTEERSGNKAYLCPILMFAQYFPTDSPGQPGPPAFDALMCVQCLSVCYCVILGYIIHSTYMHIYIYLCTYTHKHKYTTQSHDLGLW